MFNTAWKIGIIVGVVIVMVLLVTVLMPFFQEMSLFVSNDTASGNYWGYRAAGTALPMFFYALPVLVGGIAVFLILRRRDQSQ